MLTTGMPAELLEELRYLEVYTGRKIDSRLIGSHTSSFRGVGFDFLEHRRYVGGEDVRRIDWNATARQGQIFLKVDHAERELSAMVVVDLSRSMDFSSQRLTKRELLLRVAACLAFSAAADHMQLGMLAFTDQVESYLPPKRGRLQAWRILQYLWDARPRSHGTNLKLPLEALSRRLRHTSLVFLVSDFPESDFAEAPEFQVLAHRHDVVPIIVQDPLEEALPNARGYLRLRDPESGAERVVGLGARNRRRYAEEVARRRERLIRRFYELDLDHVYLRGGEPWVDPLIRLFSSRKRRQR